VNTFTDFEVGALFQLSQLMVAKLDAQTSDLVRERILDLHKRLAIGATSGGVIVLSSDDAMSLLFLIDEGLKHTNELRRKLHQLLIDKSTNN